MFTEDNSQMLSFIILSFLHPQDNYSEADPKFPIFVLVVHLLAYLS